MSEDVPEYLRKGWLINEIVIKFGGEGGEGRGREGKQSKASEHSKD